MSIDFQGEMSSRNEWTPAIKSKILLMEMSKAYTDNQESWKYFTCAEWAKLIKWWIQFHEKSWVLAEIASKEGETGNRKWREMKGQMKLHLVS